MLSGVSRGLEERVVKSRELVHSSYLHVIQRQSSSSDDELEAIARVLSEDRLPKIVDANLCNGLETEKQACNKSSDECGSSKTCGRNLP